MPESARIGDNHVCELHGGGPVLTGSTTVQIGGRPAARKGDTAFCPGAVDGIIEGSPSVLIDGKPAARKGDMTDGGMIVVGLATVLIGVSTQAALLQKAAADGTPFVEKCPQ